MKAGTSDGGWPATTAARQRRRTRPTTAMRMRTAYCGESGTLKTLKPGMSGNASADSAEAKVRTAASTSPFSNRSIALVCSALKWTESAPAATNAIQTSVPEEEYFSSIATPLSLRSDTDLISGLASTMATRRSVLRVARAAVIRSATAVAAATCCCIVLLLEFGARPTVGCAVVPEPGAAMPLFGSSCLPEEGGGSNLRFAEGSVFAVMWVGFAFVLT